MPTPLPDADILSVGGAETPPNPPVPRAGILGLLRARALGVPVVSTKRKAVAFTIAALADVAQIVLFPAFIEGAGSPVEDALDAAVALVLLLILGYSHRLLFAFALELVPGADLFPTWTAVVLSIPSTAAVDRPHPRH